MLEDAKKRMAENVICNLKKRNMEGIYCRDKKEAVETVLSLIEPRCFHRLGRLGIDPGAGDSG